MDNNDDDDDGSNSPIGKAPSSLAKGEGRFNKVSKDPRAGIVSCFDFDFDDFDFEGSFDDGGLFSSTSCANVDHP